MVLLSCSIRQSDEADGQPQAQRGALDLTAYRFEGTPNVLLDGEWELYWQQLLKPSDFTGGVTPAPGMFRLPGAWDGQQAAGAPLDGTGYATLRLRVALPASDSTYALKLPFIRTSYKMWVNGKLRAESGSVGTDRDSAVPHYTPRMLRLDPAGDKLDIVLQVSNFHHRTGGVWQSLELGPWERMQRQSVGRMAVEMIIMGSLVSMGLHHLGLVALRRKEKGSFYFGTFCVLIGIRTLFIGQGAAYYWFPEMPWVLGLRIEYLCFFLGVPAIILFARSMYPDEIHEPAIRIVQGSSLLLSLAVCMLPAPLFTYTAPLFQGVTLLACAYAMVGLIRAWVNGREGAAFAVTGAGAYIVTVVIDILYYNQLVRVGDVSSYGLLVCIFLTSFILSAKSAKAFNAVESLSRQLRELNTGLERKIRERTVELERSNLSLGQMNDDLARLETSRRHLLSNISHDLGTPMTLIQGYVEALMDGVVPPEQQLKYLKLIHGRITSLNRLIKDLFQLSKLEARQLDFDIQTVDAHDLIRYFDERYELEVAEAGFEFEAVTQLLHPPDSPGAVVKADVERIDQVLTNVMYNAMKHTPSGGLIQLQFILDEHSLIVQVQDSGEGIDPDDLPHVFDRFYKKDKSRNTSGGGSGLGLAIAREIIDYHGGRIWAQSRVGQGACIAFMLPLAKP